MKPTVGRIVHYTLTETDAREINRRRQDAVDSDVSLMATGLQMHYGMLASAGEVLPMVVTKTREGDNRICGQVYLNGNDTLFKHWVAMISYNDPDNPWGCWVWPSRV